MPKKYRVEIARAAERDVVGIYEHIERRSPERCPVISEADDIGVEYRHLIWGENRTVFPIEGSTVYVVRVIHGAQLLETEMLETRELPDRDD